MSDSLIPHELLHARLSCPLPTPELAQTHVHQVGDAIQPSHPLSLPSPPALTLSSIKIFSSELVLHINWLKYWSFSFSITCVNARLIVYPSPYFSSLATISWFSMSVSLFLFYKSVYLYHFFRFHI